MGTKFPQQVFAVLEPNGHIVFHGDLASAATASGRELGIYVFQRSRVCKLVAEWKPDPLPEQPPPPPLREEIA